MKKSIEAIWKQGFADESAGIPNIKNLNDLKSIYIMDQFKRRYQTNVLILIGTAILVLFAFVMGGVPFIGIFMFCLFASLALLGKVEIDKLDRLDKGTSNYDYIKGFDEWLKSLLIRFSFIYRIWVPLLFVGFSLALLHTNLFVPFIGETLIERLVENPDSQPFYGLPMAGMLGLLAFAVILSYFSNYLFKLEMKTMYGGLIARLDDLLDELNALR